MAASTENIPLGERPPHFKSRDSLTPVTPASPVTPTTPPTPRTTHTESTVFSLSRSQSLWAPGPSTRTRDVYWFPIHLMTTGGSILACGMLISGLFFYGHNRKVTIVLGPGLVSIGLMVLVVGLVLIPVTKDNKKMASMKRPLSCYRPPLFNV
ncbi:phosphoinositide-interacting protein-like [Osmerus mordax]|uniref:phosphoinositide-interacting protein-like n=1 Tax=Osmerus mordax TaxID=8014 RepID=UPI003510BB98